MIEVRRAGLALRHKGIPMSLGQSLTETAERSAVIILGHGTRDERGLAEFRELVALVARMLPERQVVGAFLELSRPTLSEAVEGLVARGVRRITVLPLLLLAAGHAKLDIPRAIRAISSEFPAVQLEQASHLGCHPRLLEASARRFEAAQLADQEIAAGDTLWILVGRGSPDAEASAELARFADLRRALTPVGHTQLAYLALATPRLTEVLERVGDLRFRRIVVQPHLLFFGELLEQLRSIVSDYARAWPAQQWIVADHLGPTEEIAEAVLELLAEHGLSLRRPHAELS